MRFGEAFVHGLWRFDMLVGALRVLSFSRVHAVLYVTKNLITPSLLR